MVEFEPYNLVWKECGKDGLAERFFVPGYDGFLPFLISGKDPEDGEDDLELTEFHLLSGILIGLVEFDRGDKPWLKSEDRHTLTYLLDVLRNGFGASDPELFLLDAAAALRKRYGSHVSRSALITALELIPFSSKIRSDLICDTWIVAAENNDLALLEQIPEWVRETTLDVLHNDAKELICYYGLCAMVKLGMDGDELTNFLEELIYPNVKTRTLKNKIKALLENADAYTLRELLIEIV